MKLDIRFTSNDQALEAKFSSNDKNFVADFGELQAVTEFIGGKVYEGEYEITPKVAAQTMPTSGKVMADDVTIKSIPFFNVSNTSGGSTAYIGSEV